MRCDNVSVSQNCDVTTIWLVVCNVELEPTLIMMINTNTGISDHTVGCSVTSQAEALVLSFYILSVSPCVLSRYSGSTTGKRHEWC